MWLEDSNHIKQKSVAFREQQPTKIQNLEKERN